jgi:hypothetical protein
MRKLAYSLLLSAGLAIISCFAFAMKNFPAKDFFSGSQLTLAQAIENGDLAAVQALAPKTDLNTPGRKNMTMLFFAFQEALQRDPKQLEIMTALVKAGADIRHRVPSMGSVLGIAVNAEYPEYLHALLNAGIDPNTLLDGDTPLIFDAATARTFASLKLLLARGADINRRDSLRNTALFEALMNNGLDQIDYLLDHGANPNTYNINGVSFPFALSKDINRNASTPDSVTSRKLLEIRDRLIKMAVKWPPETPEQIRARWGANAPRRLDDSQLPL